MTPEYFQDCPDCEFSYGYVRDETGYRLFCDTCSGEGYVFINPTDEELIGDNCPTMAEQGDGK